VFEPRFVDVFRLYFLVQRILRLNIFLIEFYGFEVT
jgi:hypothetical protein